MFHQKQIVSFDFMVTKSNRLYQSTWFSDETLNAFCISMMIKRLFLRTIGSSRNGAFILLLQSLTVLSQQDLEGKIIVDELRQDIITTNSKAEPPQCTSLAWSADGQVGFTATLSFWTCTSSVSDLVPVNSVWTSFPIDYSQSL